MTRDDWRKRRRTRFSKISGPAESCSTKDVFGAHSRNCASGLDVTDERSPACPLLESDRLPRRGERKACFLLGFRLHPDLIHERVHSGTLRCPVALTKMLQPRGFRESHCKYARLHSPLVTATNPKARGSNPLGRASFPWPRKHLACGAFVHGLWIRCCFSASREASIPPESSRGSTGFGITSSRSHPWFHSGSPNERHDYATRLT